MKFKPLFIVLLILISLFSFPTQAFAHSLETFYELQDKTLEIHALFSTEEPFEDADVLVHPPSDSGLETLHAFTDQQGRFRFEPDYNIPGIWSVEIGEDNHWDLLTIPVSTEGIEINAISHLDFHIPHHHVPQFANQLVVVIFALTIGFIAQVVGNPLKRWF
ncbi:hypothetical protein K4A83_21860 [Spirulina subsalsa FACHB-351]|uniref:Carboxypeptidase regulatory-like domain-containing protein n=1 Tax=Spirulina subsalsa FACHB-351 TaxID=234711 RepID=A0ABT3LBK4_9CYAN|nr:hypothetical protein [Spirulina subsalsa]MCW6038886.1 hypothetical protein [Spirulina subsalsa FACHB-351]